MESSRVSYDHYRFKSQDHEEVYNQLSNRQVIVQMKVQLGDPGEFSSFVK